MNTRTRTQFAAVILVMIALSALPAGCTPDPGATPTAPPAPATAPIAATPVPSATPTATPSPSPSPSATASPGPTATTSRRPAITLRPGDFYFSVEGTPAFTFSRNLAGYTMRDFDTLLPWAGRGGTRIARLQVSTIVAGGMGATSAGAVDFSGFAPVAARTGREITGGAVGNERLVLGWFRDAGCEPPDWPVRPVIAGQRVTLVVPGTAADWQVDFYDTATGTDIVHTATASRSGDGVTITLPGFRDDIAFKMRAVPGALPQH